jgi:preprotein translocase subunit SecA
VEIGNLEKVLRVGEGRRIKRLQEQAAYITSLEPEFERLSTADLQSKTADFRQRLENGESLDDLVFEAFAAGCSTCSSWAESCCTRATSPR